MTCFVPLHGASHGGWRWSRVAGPLRAMARAQPGWGYREIPNGHNPMITAPGLLASSLEELTA
jgi:hypothetical protein